MPDNIVILFPPGLGGNHTANLLSTADKYETRFEKTQYESNTKNAHFNKVQNLSQGGIISNGLEMQNNVLCGHWGEYYWLRVCDFSLETFLPNRKVIIISLPTEHSLAYNRMILYCPVYKERYFYEETRTAYTSEVIGKLFPDDNDFFVLDPAMIFTKDIIPFLKWVNDEMALTLDINLCEYIHAKWFKIINKCNENINN